MPQDRRSRAAPTLGARGFSPMSDRPRRGARPILAGRVLETSYRSCLTGRGWSTTNVGDGCHSPVSFLNPPRSRSDLLDPNGPVSKVHDDRLNRDLEPRTEGRQVAP